MIPSNKEEDFTSKLTIKSFCPTREDVRGVASATPYFGQIEVKF